MSCAGVSVSDTSDGVGPGVIVSFGRVVCSFDRVFESGFSARGG